MRIVWKHFPLPMHNHAAAAHMAAVAAQKQGKFWEYHDKLFANQHNLELDDLKRYAQEIGLNMEKFNKDLVDLANQKPIDDDKAEGKSVGITGTPGFFINGRFLRGAQPYEQFAKVINAELTRLKIPVPAQAQGTN